MILSQFYSTTENKIVAELTAEKEPTHWLTRLTRIYFVGGAALIVVLALFVVAPVVAGQYVAYFLMFGLGLGAFSWGTIAKSIPGAIVAALGGVWMLILALLLVTA